LTLEKAADNIWLLHLHPEGTGGLEGGWTDGWEGGLGQRQDGDGLGGWRVAGDGGGTACSSAQSQPGQRRLP
ncbi:hypothetical protein N301_08472, partial [Charadrius vociferus]